MNMKRSHLRIRESKAIIDIELTGRYTTMIGAGRRLAHCQVTAHISPASLRQFVRHAVFRFKVHRDAFRALVKCLG